MTILPLYILMVEETLTSTSSLLLHSVNFSVLHGSTQSTGSLSPLTPRQWEITTTYLLISYSLTLFRCLRFPYSQRWRNLDGKGTVGRGVISHRIETCECGVTSLCRGRGVISHGVETCGYGLTSLYGDDSVVGKRRDRGDRTTPITRTDKQGNSGRGLGLEPFIIHELCSNNLLTT